MLKLKSPSLLPRFPLASTLQRTVYLSKMSETTGPILPKFIPVERHEISSVSKHDGFKFSLISYNILAQAYVKSSFFPHSPSPCLKWKSRSLAIMTVLKSLEADFLCLQEVDEYDSFYKRNMDNLGYSSVYVKRNGQKRDGCSIFYKHDSAELVMEEKIDYNDLVHSIPDETGPSVDIKNHPAANESNVAEEKHDPKTSQANRGDPNDPHVRLKRDCVGIMAVFKLKEFDAHHIIVANTHLYWDPEWADVKLAQAKYLLTRLSQFKTLVSEKLGFIPAVVVAGDFNSTPGDQVYQYLVSGSSSEGPLAESGDDLPIPLCSVYASSRGEPRFTNCTPEFTGTIDYILFNPSDDIKPVSFLELPEPDSADVEGGLPNHYHPSDHLPIGAQFEIIR